MIKNIDSNFKNDLIGENVLSQFLDKYLYDKLDIQNLYKNNNDSEDFLNNQYKGIDIKFSFKGKEFLIDEKATLHYPNGISTFAFELKYKKNGIWKEGWLFDTKKITEYYLLAWPIRNNVELKDLNITDIRKVEVMLINRQTLINYLDKSFNLNVDTINEEVKKIINANKFGKLHNIHSSSNHYYYYTERLVENPINIIIQKEKLSQIADFHFKVYRNVPYSQQPKFNSWLKKEYCQIENNSPTTPKFE